jgi:uncharacterized membrane protein
LRKSTPIPDRQRLVLAAVGALRVSCMMTQLPLIGVTGVCLITALLNFAAALARRRRKAAA